MIDKLTNTTGLSHELLSLDAKNKELNAIILRLESENLKLRTNNMENVKNRDMVDLTKTRNEAQLAHIDDTLKRLRAAKPPERSEEARCYAIVITEIEKARAYFKTYILDVDNGNQA